MKKIFLIIIFVSVFMITGCVKKEKTVEDLLDEYIVAYTTADVELTKEIFPSFYIEYSKEYLTKERLEKSLQSDKEKLGDDFKATYDITKKTKMTDEELENINKKMTDTYKATENATECYKLEGTMTFKGSKDQIVDSLSSVGYCKYSSNWFLVRIY